jgi:hypothetical protein
MKNLVILLAVLLVFASCESKVDLDVEEGPKNIVIDGGISDQSGKDTVRLTITQNYNSTADYNKVVGATLVVTQNGTLIDTLKEVNNGVYVTQTTVGVIGDFYQLYIKTPEGIEYESTIETMPQVPPIDSLYFRKKDELVQNTFLEDGYYGVIAYQDPPEVRNYYRHKIWINDTAQATAFDILISDDRYTDGQYNPEANERYVLKVGDKFRIVQIATSSFRYDYMTNQKTLLTANGGPFDPPPGPVIGNIFKKGSTTEYALGYFQATSQVEEEGVVVER